MSPPRRPPSGIVPGVAGGRPRLLDHLRSEPRRALGQFATAGADAPLLLPRAELAASRCHELVLAALPRERFVSCYHAPCSGSLSGLLAGRCHHLLAGDTGAESGSLVGLARTPNVTLVRHTLPEDFPDGPFDLMVLGDLHTDLDQTGAELARRVVAALAPGAVLVTLAGDGTGAGSTLHERLGSHGDLAHQGHWEDPGFRLDLWLRS